jgi:CRISPR-associated endonuclease/helicase Cas3
MPLGEMGMFKVNRTLRDFQNTVKSNLTEGKSTIVSVPTGLGKTLAAILPFIENASDRLGTRIIYSLPIRALAKGVYEEFKNQGVEAVIHHGEEPESNIFSESTIITTVDQYFTAFAGTPISWSSSVGHTAAGAILTSYAVFDEIHLLNPKNGLQLLFAILRLRNRWRLPTTIMTATLPDSVIDFLESKCGLKKVEATEKDIQGRDSWREVHLTFYKRELDIDGLAKFIKECYDSGQRKIIVFVNTVERAIYLYKELKKEDTFKDMVLLAHSRFSKNDRKRIEDEMHEKFGKNSEFEGILVTTQVAEAGLNVSAPLVITELAPLDSLIQRAGRCARFKKNSRKVKGEIIVIKPKVEGDQRWYAPYFDYIRLRKGGTEAFIKNKETITISELTWIVLLEKAKSNIRLDWKTEKELLSLTLNDVYHTFINGSDIVYFKDLENEEMGNIIKEHKDVLRSG